MARDAQPVVGQGLAKPLSFIENKGQVRDADNRVRNDIQYKLSTPGMNLYIGNGQLHYQFNKIEAGAQDGTYSNTSYLTHVALLGANPHARVVAQEAQAYYENYYLAQYGSSFTAHSWNRIVYQDVFPNIDWVLYVKGNNIEYDFVVRPGGNVADIRLQYDGTTSLALNADGGISATTPMGTIAEKRPYAYEKETGREVASSFSLNKNIVTFHTAPHRGTLTIDPYLLWSTYFGGTAEDQVTAVKILSTAATVATGYTASTGLNTTAAAFAGGTYDAFVTSISNTGARNFTTYLGGTGADKGLAITADNNATQNIYVAGSTTSATGLYTTGAYHTTNFGNTDGFLTKINSTGGISWSTYYGGTGTDAAYGVACDVSNNVYITGATTSATSINSSSTVAQPALSGTQDAFVAKFSTLGAVQWSTYFGGTAQETGMAIACDASNNVAVTGQTNSVAGVASSTSVYQSALNGTNDAFIIKYNTAGTRQWSTYYGGSGMEQGNGIVCDQTSGAIALVGNTSSTDMTVTSKAFQNAYGGGVQDAFVAYLTAAGVMTWNSYYGGNDLDYGQAICLDPNRNILIAGGTFSTNNIASTIALQTALAGSDDAYIVKFNRLGQRLWGTYFGGSLYDFANGISCDALNEPVIGGYTTSTAGISTTGTYITTFQGGTSDGFLAKLKADTTVSIVQPYTDTVICKGVAFSISYNVNATFATGNVFTAQLSDATGSFATPVAIGTVTGTTSGTMAVIIPAGTAAGTGYRIRIVSTKPAFISPDDYYNIQIMAALPHTTITSNSPVCAGNNLAMSDASSYAVTGYTWYNPAGTSISATATASVSSVTTANAGTYSVVTTHNGCPADTATVAVTVNTFIPPAPAASSSVPNCVGGTISLYANSGLVVPATYYWTGPAGYTATNGDPVISPAAGINQGWYYVQDTLGGCVSPKDSVYVTVEAVVPVSVTIAASPSDTICQDHLVTFTASAVSGGVSPAYQWYKGGTPVVGAVSGTWSSSSLLSGDMIYCTLNSSADCPSVVPAVSDVVTMTVINNPPIVHITATPAGAVMPGDTVTFSCVTWNAGTAPLFQWRDNGVDIPGATNATYTMVAGTANDTITLVLASTMLCATPSTATSNTVIVHPVTAGVTGVTASLDEVGLFPNPNSGTFTLSGNLNGMDVNTVTYEVLNPLGQVIATGTTDVRNGRISQHVALGNIAAGVYLLNITADGRSKAIRFTVGQ